MKWVFGCGYGSLWVFCGCGFGCLALGMLVFYGCEMVFVGVSSFCVIFYFIY